MNMSNLKVKTPWMDQFVGVPPHLSYYEGSMVSAVEKIALQYPDAVAFDFMGEH